MTDKSINYLAERDLIFSLKSQISEVLVSVDTESNCRHGKIGNKLILTRKLPYFSIMLYRVYSFTLMSHLTSVAFIFLTEDLKKQWSAWLFSNMLMEQLVAAVYDFTRTESGVFKVCNTVLKTFVLFFPFSSVCLKCNKWEEIMIHV